MTALKPGWDYQKVKHPRYKYATLRQQSVETEIYPEVEICGANGFVYLKERGVLMAQKGYHWDGASGPTFDTSSTMRASLFHDCLYQLLREKQLDVDDYRKDADELLYRLMREDGAWRWRARLWLWAVRWFAGKAAR